MASSKLPTFALFPIATWRDQVLPDEWVACLNAWLALIDSHLSLSDSDFLAISIKDDSLQGFLTSFTREVALGGVSVLGSSSSAKRLLKDCFALITKLLQSPTPPSGLAQWEFLADLSRAYGKKKTEPLLDGMSAASKASLDSSLSALKKFLVKNLDAGISGGDLKTIEERLERANDLIRVSPSVAEFFLAGSDFVDGLISCYKITNPPLRKVLIATTYLCLVGLAEGQKMSALTDQLYSLKAAADMHKAGPLNVNDSLVAELVTSTPLLQRLQRKLEDTESASTRTKSVLTELGTLKKPGGGMSKPKRLIKRKIDKGKGLAEYDEAQAQQEIHIHRMSQISQVQDLFPELGTGFISKLLDEYSNSTEAVIAHLLDNSLPPHLQTANRSEDLPPHPRQQQPRRRSSLAPRSTPPFPPATYPAAAEDEEEDLTLLTSTSRLHIGKRPGGDASTLLSNPTTSKAAILSALAAFDSDDDERDDTYDAADVGGTVDTPTAGDEILPEGTEAVLFRTWMASPGVFARDNDTRRGKERLRLREETSMTDEAVEGWAVMLGRDAGLKRRLMARYGEWTGEQVELGSTAWRAGVDDAEEEGEGSDGAPGAAGAKGGRGGGGPGRGRGRGRGGRGGRGGAPPPAADSELGRRRKEANKGSRANHNRRDQRARKMARGGFAG
jgi:activating signal cointegrator complex subunit 2